MTAIEIKTDGLTVQLHSPYDATLIRRAKELGGRWSAAARAWSFDSRDENRVRDLARSVFGTDGSADMDGPSITLRIPCANLPGIYDQEIRLAGRRLAYRPARDDAVRLGLGVVLVDGGFCRSSGSRANPRIGDNNAMLEVRDLSQGEADLMMAARSVATVL